MRHPRSYVSRMRSKERQEEHEIKRKERGWSKAEAREYSFDSTRQGFTKVVVQERTFELEFEIEDGEYCTKAVAASIVFNLKTAGSERESYLVEAPDIGSNCDSQKGYTVKGYLPKFDLTTEYTLDATDIILRLEDVGTKKWEGTLSGITQSMSRFKDVPAFINFDAKNWQLLKVIPRSIPECGAMSVEFTMHVDLIECSLKPSQIYKDIVPTFGKYKSLNDLEGELTYDKCENTFSWEVELPDFMGSVLDEVTLIAGAQLQVTMDAPCAVNEDYFSGDCDRYSQMTINLMGTVMIDSTIATLAQVATCKKPVSATFVLDGDIPGFVRFEVTFAAFFEDQIDKQIDFNALGDSLSFDYEANCRKLLGSARMSLTFGPWKDDPLHLKVEAYQYRCKEQYTSRGRPLLFTASLAPRLPTEFIEIENFEDLTSAGPKAIDLQIYIHYDEKKKVKTKLISLYFIDVPLWGYEVDFRVGFGSEGKRSTVTFASFTFNTTKPSAVPHDGDPEFTESMLDLSKDATEVDFELSNKQFMFMGRNYRKGLSIIAKCSIDMEEPKEDDSGLAGMIKSIFLDPDSPLSSLAPIPDNNNQVHATLGVSITNPTSFRLQYLLIGGSTDSEFDENKTMVISAVGLFTSKTKRNIRIGLVCQMEVLLDREVDLFMSFSAEFIFVMKSSKGVLSVRLELNLFVGSFCPAIDGPEFCSTDQFCCWKNPFDFCEKLVIVFPFSFSIQIKLVPIFQFTEISMQFKCFIGDFSFEIAVVYDPVFVYLSALYLKVTNFKLSDILSELIPDCDDCLDPISFILDAFTVEYFEVSINPSPLYEFPYGRIIAVGTKIIPPGFLIDVRNLNYMDIIIVKKFYITITLTIVEFDIEVEPIEFSDLLVIGYKGESTKFKLKISPSEVFFFIRGGIRLLGGIIEVNILAMMDSKAIYAAFDLSLFGFDFKLRIRGPTPIPPELSDDEDREMRIGKVTRKLMDKRAAGEAPIRQLPDVDTRTCHKTTRAVRSPNLINRADNCSMLPEGMDPQQVSYLLWSELFGALSCGDHELLNSFTLTMCKEPGSYRAQLSCLKSLKTKNPTTRFSELIEIPTEARDSFGLQNFLKGQVGCGIDAAMNSFSFQPPPGRPTSHKTRTFKLNCAQPNEASMYQFANGTEETVMGPCAIQDNSLTSLSKLTTGLECPGTKVLRAFELVKCDATEALLDKVDQGEMTLDSVDLDDVVQGYGFKFLCVGVELVDLDPSSPGNTKLPASAFNFADMEGDMVQLKVCKGGILPPILQETVVTKVEPVLDELICPPGEAMMSFKGEYIECFDPGLLALNTNDRNWSAPFTIQDSMVDCGQGLVVGFKRSGTGGRNKQILCQPYKPMKEGEVVFFELESFMHTTLQKFMASIFEAIIAIFRAAAEALRAAGKAVGEAADWLEEKQADLDRAKETADQVLGLMQMKIDAKQAEYEQAKVELADREVKHGLCSGWDCVGTFAKVGVQFLAVGVIWIALGLLKIEHLAAKVLVEAGFYIISQALSFAVASLRLVEMGLNALADGADSLADGMAEQIKEMSETTNEDLKNLFRIDIVYFFFKLSSHAITVVFEVDFTIFGLQVNPDKIEIELSWPKLVEQLIAFYMGKMESSDEDVDDVDKTRGGLRSGYNSWRQKICDTAAGALQDFGPRRRLRDGSTVRVIHDDDVDMYEDAVKALDSSSRSRGFTVYTHEEAVTMNYFTNKIKRERYKRKIVDNMERTYDANRGLRGLCDILSPRSHDEEKTRSIRRETRGQKRQEEERLMQAAGQEGQDIALYRRHRSAAKVLIDEAREEDKLDRIKAEGFISIKQTNAQKRTHTGFEELPSCLFHRNPNLRTISLRGLVTGVVPTLTEHSKLEVFSVSHGLLGGQWDELLTRSRELRIFNVQDNNFFGTIGRETWPSTLKSLSIVANQIQIDPAAMFDSMQHLSNLQQAFWGRNVQVVREDFGEKVRRRGRLSTLASRVKPLTSVLYGVLEAKDLQMIVCGQCSRSELHPYRCYEQECADQDALELVIQDLTKALSSAGKFSPVRIDSLRQNGKLTFSAHIPHLDKSAREDTLQVVEEAIAATFPDYKIKSRFGCSPGAVGPQCEYICRSGWRRHDPAHKSPFPQCVEPSNCNKGCTDVLRTTMDICTNALYQPHLEIQCLNAIEGAGKTCDRCQFYNGRAQDYNGAVDVTKGGLKCQQWDKVPSFKRPKQDMRFWDHNHCRNYKESAKDNAWCHTTDGNWDYCDVGTPSLGKCLNEGTNCIDIALHQFMEIFR